MNGQERRDFVRSHRVAVFGYNRREHGLALTVVDYVMEGDDLLVSTMAARGKAKAGRVRIETDAEPVVDLGMRIMALMAEQPIPESYRPHVAERARREERVVVCVTRP